MNHYNHSHRVFPLRFRKSILKNPPITKAINSYSLLAGVFNSLSFNIVLEYNVRLANSERKL